MINYRNALYCSVAILALGTSYEANAQDASSDSEVAGLEAILVVAQRREENLQDVPFSVTAVSATALEQAGITNSRDLAMVTPGLRIESFGPYVQPSLRGITTSLTGVSNESNVAVYVDGVYQPTILGALYSLPDVQQVEVLKGPQGTLFGRNATGGAVLINTMKPDLDELTGKVAIGYSSFDTKEAKGFVSAPIVAGKLAASISGMYSNSDGHLNNIAPVDSGYYYQPKVEEWLVRGKIRFVPWEGADFVLTGLYTDIDDTVSSAFMSLNGNGAGRAAVLAAGLPFATYKYDFAFNTKPIIDQQASSVSLRGTIDVGPGALTTTTSYNHLKSRIETDADNTMASVGPFTSIDALGKLSAFSQELLYNTDQLGRFRGTFGVFYFQNTARQDPVIYRGRNHRYTLDKVKSYAVFGEVTYNVTDSLSLTGGARYSYEKRDSFWTETIAGAPTTRPEMLPVGTDTIWLNRPHTSWESVTPRVSLQYEATDDTNLYFTYSKGFKSGTFNPNAVPAQLDPVNPEKVDSFEVGFKSDLTPSLRVNGAAFYYDYQDIQVTALIGGSSQVTNAAKAEIKGLELTGEWRALESLRFSFGGTYLDAEYKDYPTAITNVPRLVAGVPVGGNTTLVADVSGNQMIRAPKYSANLSGTYAFDNSLGDFALTSSLMYSSRVYYEVGNRVSQSPYAVLNLVGSFQPAGTSAEIKLWAKNITSTGYIQSTAITSGGDEVRYAQPRSIGVELGYKF